jgi:hypothetical protein
MRIWIATVMLLSSAALFVPSEAGAVVCARGVVRAGCAGPNGAVVARRPVRVVPRAVVVQPVHACRWINGVRVCR